jgi:phosphatidylserine/phosphatidylglycerophosphate/cardiolipin synthase-like enzyme
MRKLVTNSPDDFRVKAYAGTNGVLLAMDVDESRRAGLLGFAIEKKVGSKDWEFLLNSLTFPGKAHTIPEWEATPSDLAPFQKMRWADYRLEPRQTVKYRVHLAYGSADQPDLDEKLELEVRTDDGKPGNHRVIFNRAVAASQAFGRKFKDVDEWLTTHKNAPIEDWPSEKARDWLHNGLLDQIEAFINRARDGTWTLDLAIYEYELKAIVDAINAAHKRGVRVRVLYHAKDGDDQTAANEKSVKKLPVKKKRARLTKKLFHNKFIVLGKKKANGEVTPRAVLCGSTNFTENGVYRQANVVHVANDAGVAGAYAKVFQVIWDAPADTSIARTWINANNAIDAANKMFVGFSPRSGGGDLAEFVNCIAAADKDLLFATAFELPANVLDALLGAPNDSVLRFGIQNTKSRITGFHADRTAEFTTPALLNNGLEGWVKEGLRGQKGNLLVHLKTIVANFTTDNPTIISGSHNLSGSASNGNDENFLIMRGDTDLADRYGIEVLRFYEHYRFRFYAKLLALQAARPLEPDGGWADKYYQPGHLKQLTRLRFAGR